MVFKGQTINDERELKLAIIKHQKIIYKKIKLMKFVFLAFLELIGVLLLFFSITTFSGYLDSFPTFQKTSNTIKTEVSAIENNIAETGDLIKNLIYDFSYTFGGILLVLALIIISISTYNIIKNAITPLTVSKEEVESIFYEEILKKDLDSKAINKQI